MGWDLAGKRVKGMYLGLFSYSGIVLSSRVKYGGNVQHHVQVDIPITAYGETRETILVDSEEVSVS